LTRCITQSPVCTLKDCRQAYRADPFQYLGGQLERYQFGCRGDSGLHNVGHINQSGRQDYSHRCEGISMRFPTDESALGLR